MLYNTIQLSPNFNLSELTHSQTAIENAIDNTPDEKSLENLKYLCKNLGINIHIYPNFILTKNKTNRFI